MFWCGSLRDAMIAWVILARGGRVRVALLMLEIRSWSKQGPVALLRASPCLPAGW